MVGNHSLHGLGSEQDEVLTLSGRDHGRCTNDSINSVQDDVPRKFQLDDANRLAITLKSANKVFVGFIEAVNPTRECHFTHRTAYGDSLETAINKKSEALLDKMQVCYPNIFIEPKYPITQK